MASWMPRLATLSRSEVACCTPNGVKSASNTCDTNIYNHASLYDLSKKVGRYFPSVTYHWICPICLLMNIILRLSMPYQVD